MTQAVVLETSAIIAILMDEPSSERFLDQIADARTMHCPACCVVEAVVVLTRKTDAGVTKARADVLALLSRLQVEIAPLDETAMNHALDGYSAFGQGKGKPPAVLNFGDCLSYGAAKAASGTLLYTGGDFAATDLA